MSIIGQLREKFRMPHLHMSCTEEEVYKKDLDALKTDNKLIYVGALLQRAAVLYPNNVAVIFEKKSYTWSKLFYLSMLLTKKLIDAGVQKEDRVILLQENSPEFYIAYFAILQAGAICVPVNTFLHEKELLSINQDCTPRLVLTSSNLKSMIDLSLDVNKKELLEMIQEALPVIDDTKPCLLLYTSGTTGSPKGVMLSSKNIIVNSTQAISRLVASDRIKNHLQEERFFAALPLFHVFAQNTCVWIPAIVGGTVIVVPKIDRKDIFEALNDKPTLFFGVPALYGLLTLMKNAPLENVKYFISGGDAMPDKIKAAFALVYGRKVCSGYGLTEASPIIGFYPDNNDKSVTVIGKPLPGIMCEVRDDEFKIVKNGKVGTLWVKGDNVMLGYYKAPEATNEVLQDGWLNTGDLASIDVQGNVAILGRTKDLIIHKGFNIYPQEVENVLMSHPAVFRAAVVGREDPMSGQVPVAYISLKSLNNGELMIIEEKLKKYCNEHLASYKIPRKFICVEDLPVNSTGKIDKKRLQLD